MLDALFPGEARMLAADARNILVWVLLPAFFIVSLYVREQMDAHPRSFVRVFVRVWVPFTAVIYITSEWLPFLGTGLVVSVAIYAAYRLGQERAESISTGDAEPTA